MAKAAARQRKSESRTSTKKTSQSGKSSQVSNCQPKAKRTQEKPRKDHNDTDTETRSAYEQRLGLLSREAVLFITVAVTLFLLAALVSYNPGDPGWTGSGNGTAIGNLLGAPGAWFADVLLSLFGYLGFVFPLLFLYGGWLLFTNRPPSEDALGSKSIRGAMLALCFISACGLSWLFFGGMDNNNLPQGNGGVIGSIAAASLASVINPIGAAWALITVFMISLSMGLGFSWLTVADRLGRFVMEGVKSIWAMLQTRHETWQAGRAERVAEKARLEPQDKIEQPVSGSAAVQPAETRRAGASVRKVAQSAAASVVKKTAQPQKDSRKRSSTPVRSPRSLSPAPEGVPTFDPAKDSPIPPIDLLDAPPAPKSDNDEDKLQRMSAKLEQNLSDFNVQAKVVAVEPGPVVTRFEIDPAPGVKVNQITNLSKDLARAMSTTSVRVVEVIPGKSVVGLEVPNHVRDVVSLREILDTKLYKEAISPLTIGLGKNIGGHPVTANLSKMPHLLVAGTTGSGKSVAVNAMILSLLHKAKPDEVRMILIDPKMLELSVYEGIPHLLSPVVTDMKDAANALRWCVGEMERRYKLMSALGVRNMAGFNTKVQQAIDAGQPIEDPLLKQAQSNDAAQAGEEVPTLEPLPAIVIVVDELADMMMVVGKKVEELIARIAQKARAAGLHMILATQRPSVDVITGLIKANIPTRIGFQVASKVDSRTILDQQGAEALLGYGDMLYLPPGSGFPNRVHGAFVDDHEVHKVVEYLKQTGQPDYVEEIFEGAPIDGESGEKGEEDAESDPLYDQAVAIAAKSRKASISYIQRRLRVGYNRSARLIEQMEQAGIVSPAEGSGGREVLVPPPPEDD